MAARSLPLHHLEEAFDYPRKVVSGELPAGRWAKAACERFHADYTRAQEPGSRWIFDKRQAVAPIVFAELLPHVKGPRTGETITLLPFQKWLLANLFGFLERATGRRRFRQASIWMPKGNAKSTLAAILGLYCTFTEGEGGAESYSAAVSREQARIAFDIARQMVLKTPGFARAYGVEVTAHAIAQVATMSSFRALSSATRALDGLNLHFGVLDELGSHRTAAVHDALLTAMGKRAEPLLVSISTATDHTAGVGRAVWNYTEQVLSGALDDPRFFGAIYAADPEDDAWSEATWQKANPGWGSVVQPEAVKALAKQALATPALAASFKSRHLNIWTAAENALFSVEAWKACADAGLRLEDFRGEPCWVGIDMAARTDIAAGVLLFPRADQETGKTHYVTFAKAWLPERAVDADRNPLYVSWAQTGHLTVTPGETVDFAEIEDWTREIGREFDLRTVGYDPYFCMQLAQRLQNDGIPVTEYRSSTLNFSAPTKELDALMRERRIRHTGDPVLAHCLANVVGHEDNRGAVYPKKADRTKKIDLAIALIIALGVRLAAEADGGGYIYADGRELRVW